MNRTQIIVAIGWACSQFAAGLTTLDMTPLNVNPAAIGLIALGLNTLGGALYMAVGRPRQ